jgi:hypothetical protein
MRCPPMPRAPTTCARPGCPRDATSKGYCAQHQRKAWANRSPSSHALNAPGAKAQHRGQRIRAARRAQGACEHCGHKPTADEPPLQLHHPEPISQGGDVVQAEARLLCDDCHRRADRKAGARH